MGTWRHCSSCRASIGFEQIYWECSVSTCARVARTGLFFCSVSCWEAHLPTMRHREAWAVEKKAPTEASWQRQQAEEAGGGSPPDRPPVSRQATPAPITRQAAPAPVARPVEARRVVSQPAEPIDGDDDVLIVVSKLKKYIRNRSGMNTSDNVMSVLSDHLRRVCDRAIRHATEEGRKTVLDRDFQAIL
jgi:hypothetical protein